MHIEWKALSEWVCFALGFGGGRGRGTLVVGTVNVTSSHRDGWVDRQSSDNLIKESCYGNLFLGEAILSHLMSWL